MDMKLQEVEWPHYIFEINGEEVVIKGSYNGEGLLLFTPEIGWSKLEKLANAPAETILEAIDELIYNADPERFNIEQL